MSLRFVAVPLLGGLFAALMGWVYRKRPLSPQTGSVWEDSARDPVGPSPDVILALERVQQMKITSEAEALAGTEDEMA